MNQAKIQHAIEILSRLKESLMDSLVEELVQHEDDDASSFRLQEIEDRFSMRLSNLNTLIATLQDQLDMDSGSQFTANVYEATRDSLEEKIQSLLSPLHPDDLVNLSVCPLSPERYLIIITQLESFVSSHSC